MRIDDVDAYIEDIRGPVITALDTNVLLDLFDATARPTG